MYTNLQINTTDTPPNPTYPHAPPPHTRRLKKQKKGCLFSPVLPLLNPFIARRPFLSSEQSGSISVAGEPARTAVQFGTVMKLSVPWTGTEAELPWPFLEAEVRE